MQCPVCNGSGISPGSERIGGLECGACNGSGVIADDDGGETASVEVPATPTRTLEPPVTHEPEEQPPTLGAALLGVAAKGLAAFLENQFSTATDLSGDWRGSDGFLYRLHQTGNTVQVQGFNPTTQMIVVEGQGTLQGGTLEVHFQGVEGFGHARVTLAADGRHLQGFAQNQATGVSAPITLSR